MAAFLKFYKGAQPNKKRKIEVPATNCADNKKAKQKEYEVTRERNFKPHWLVDRDWLCHDDTANVMYCKFCRAENSRHRRDPGLEQGLGSLEGRGTGIAQALSWVEGTSNFKLDTIITHEKSVAHDKATKACKNREQPEKSEAAAALKQLSISQLTNLRLKMRNAHATAKKDFSFLDYVSLCQLDRAKNLSITETYENDKSCRLFVHHISMVETDKTVKMLSDGNFFSITIDGSTDVSGQEVESIFVHSSNKGKRWQRFLGFVSPDSTCSVDIHNAVKGILGENGIDAKKIVGLTTDGASNMLGVKKGLAALMKKECPDLISIHCLAHRLELAIKDAIKQIPSVSKNYEKCMTLLIGLYYFYKKSPKQRKHLEKMFAIMEVKRAFPTRAGGTRWIPHTMTAISTLMKSYPVIVAQLQDASHTVPKAEGLVKLATDASLFGFMMVLKEVLAPMETLSKTLQNDKATVADAFFMVDSSKEMLESYCYENSEELKDICTSQNYKGVALRGNIPTFMYRRPLVDAILKCLDGRFTAERDFYQSMNIVNFVIWPEPQDKNKITAFGESSVKCLIDTFSKRFREPEELMMQWRKLKTLIYQRYRKPEEVEKLQWAEVNKAMANQGVEDVLSLVDLILSLPPTSVCNERSFSHMKLIKGYKRSRLTINAMTEVMIVKTLSPSVENFDPEEAIVRFLMKTPSGGQRRPEFHRTITGKQADIAEEIDTQDDDSDSDIEPGFESCDVAFERVLAESMT